MTPIADGQGGLFARLTFWITRRKVAALTGKATVPGPVRVMATHAPVLMAYGGFETMLARADKVAPRLKTLASIRAATLVGCPF